MKRLFDIAASFAGLVILSPVFLAIWLMLKYHRVRKPIFAQPRVGQNQVIFTCYKFRTMNANTPQAATHEVGAEHITTFGKTLRRWKLDELPQLWNVLIGEMSLVGPRPCLENQVALVRARVVRGVYNHRPGITGLAQVQGIDMSDPERLAFIDAEYCADTNFLEDMKIILKTIF